MQCAVLPPADNIIFMLRKSQDFFEMLGTSESDSRATIGSRKHVAIILRNSVVRIFCQNKVHHFVKRCNIWHFSLKLALKCRNVPIYPHYGLYVGKKS